MEITTSNKLQSHFESLNFDTVITTTSYDDVKVEINPDFMMKDYGKAVARDLERRNPVRFQTIQEQLKTSNCKEFGDVADVLSVYFTDLAKIRIQSINDECKVWRQAKALAIPPYIQFALSQIGMVRDLEHGRKIVPVVESPDLAMSTAQLFYVTELLRSFEGDGVVLLYDGFPRRPEGDDETMYFAIIDGFIKSPNKLSNPAKSYVAAFLGMKLQQENSLKCLYSVRYDDAEYIKERLIEELTKW
jgi:hypothetical protein